MAARARLGSLARLARALTRVTSRRVGHNAVTLAGFSAGVDGRLSSASHHPYAPPRHVEHGDVVNEYVTRPVLHVYLGTLTFLT